MTARNPLSTNPEPCKHLSDNKLKQGFNGYKSVLKCVKIIPNGRSSIGMSNTKIPSCDSCNEYRGRLYFCLVCSSISCVDHILTHTQFQNGHDIAVDIERAELYCVVCHDQVYDPDFDKAVMSKHVVDMPNVNYGIQSIGGRLRKRKRSVSAVRLVDLKNPQDLVLTRDQRAKSCYPLGLRGLNNLGSTCFMNSVLQALLHAPPLKNYFLTNQHDRSTCRKKSAERLCLPCDIDGIFSAVFSGDRSPYSPAQFLYSSWQHSANLASYEQQDAHEFFISVLDGIHEESKIRNTKREIRDCKCIAHKAFSGLLRSDVTCMACGFTSTTYDPCVDISLNLDATSYSAATVANMPDKPNEISSSSSLLGCLDLYTRPEKLGSDQKLYCEKCRERKDSLKQLSIRRLPLVLCLHIKRFEHSLVRKMSRKINSYLHFPFSLDMMPYLSSSVIRSRFGNRIFAFEGDESDLSTEFEVFAVVTHSGTLESGHYMTYLRLRNQWYKCDDAWITEVDERIVRASQCYMMFYVQKMLNENLSYQPISLTEETFHPIYGC
ncbi:ubiquitin C-terminal hydrolase 22 [Humulus lupulus]|uniref:ubiquitin C-terminal hydrolase 22 n=1 Tax=Humulus lupulus TaxID=3486 RepID=UPI002B40813C|nr:ubiquitin C-terminal hydrolase 22 [Humulus lupulus]